MKIEEEEEREAGKTNKKEKVEKRLAGRATVGKRQRLVLG